MSFDAGRVDRVARGLDGLQGFCDRGFALAVHIRYTRPTLLYQTYDQAWSDHYSEKGFMLSDPVVHWGLVNAGWVEWDSLADQDPAGVLVAAKAHGLTNGWTFSTGAAASRTIAGLPRSGAPFTQAERDEMAGHVQAIHAATEGFDTFPPALQEALRALR